MGNLSASHFSNYPPVNQLFFVVAGFLSNHSILGGTIVFETSFSRLLNFVFWQQIIRKLGLERHRIFWFFIKSVGNYRTYW
jgi:hypothetical protein